MARFGKSSRRTRFRSGNKKKAMAGVKTLPWLPVLPVERLAVLVDGPGRMKLAFSAEFRGNESRLVEFGACSAEIVAKMLVGGTVFVAFGAGKGFFRTLRRAGQFAGQNRSTFHGPLEGAIFAIHIFLVFLPFRAVNLSALSKPPCFQGGSGRVDYYFSAFAEAKAWSFSGSSYPAIFSSSAASFSRASGIAAKIAFTVGMSSETQDVASLSQSKKQFS